MNARSHSGRTRGAPGPLLVLLLACIICHGAGALAAGRAHSNRRHPPTAMLSLRLPERAAVRAPAPNLLAGQALTLRGSDHGLRHVLALTTAALRSVRRGLVGGKLPNVTDEKGKNRTLVWTAGGVPMSSLPTNASLTSSYCYVPDRLPGDPATVYRLTVFTLRF